MVFKCKHPKYLNCDKQADQTAGQKSNSMGCDLSQNLEKSTTKYINSRDC